MITLVFIAFFFLLIPVIILYSAGYRLDKGFSIKSTGGMYIFYPESGAQVYLNGVLSDQTSLFERGIFIDKLDPSSFSLEVRKAGYLPWKKTMQVSESRVSEAYPFLVPAAVSTSSVQRFVTLASGTSVTNSLYEDVKALFEKKKTATSTAAVQTFASSTSIVREGVAISIEDRKIIASWRGAKDSTPFYFCDAERLLCKESVVVAEGDIRDVDFYPGRSDVIIYSTKDAIYAAELDLRPMQNVHILLSGNLQFKEDDGRVFVKDKNGYYELLFAASSTLVNQISI